MAQPQAWAVEAVAQLAAAFGQTAQVLYTPQAGGPSRSLTAIIGAGEAASETRDKGDSLVTHTVFNFALADIGSPNINDTITDAVGLVWGITHTEATPFNGRLIAYCERADLITRHRRNA